MKRKANEITDETKEIWGCCQGCSHEWEEHYEDGCTRDFCSCPAWQKQENES